MSLKDFELGKELGKGAFGSVYIVKRKEDGKTYAMKRVKISSLSPKEGEYALNEIRILASLSHLNIIGYKEAFFDDQSKTLNIVMEFADDGDLSSKIAKNSKTHLVFQESTIWIWLIQILEGLKYLHENRIMHRDLKSANIFLMKNGMLKLGDLNVSKLVKMGMAQTQAGTPYYCSPEIWLDKPYNYKSDIWSVGCILYELATLRPPFQGTSLKDLSRNITKGVYDPIPTIYSRELSKIISKMLVVDPNYRMSTDQLLKDEIIIKKIEEYKNLIDFIGKNHEKKAEMINTIKLPKNLREINKALPKKQYVDKNTEIEMMENEEYELLKNGLNKQNSDERNKEQKNQQMKDKSNNNVEGYKPIIKESNEKQSINNSKNKNNYIDVFLQKDKEKDPQLNDKNKDAYYYKHYINPFAKQDQNNSDKCSPSHNHQIKNSNNLLTENNKSEEKTVLTNPNQSPYQHNQRDKPKSGNSNNKSPIVNKRPKSSQHRPSKCLPSNDIVSSPSNGHKAKPPSAVRPIISKPQKNNYEKLDYNRYNNNNRNKNNGISPAQIIRQNPREVNEKSHPLNHNNNNQKHHIKNQIVHFRN